MGCLFSRLRSSDSLPSPSGNIKSKKIAFAALTRTNSYDCQIREDSVASPPSSSETPASITSLRQTEPPKQSISENDPSRVQLHIPIYVAEEPFHTIKAHQISFEKNDEMKLIEEISSNELLVTHLRSGLTGIIPRNLVRLDVETPLRLAVCDQGVIQQCLMQYNVPGAYIIRHSASNPQAFVLSISQFNEQYNTLTWNYLICIDPSNNCFYFSQEVKLRNIFFSSFQDLIRDERVQDVIPLTDILPYSVEFEEEVWKIPFDELEVNTKIGEGQFGEVFRANWYKGRRKIPVAVKKLHIRGVTNTVEREIEAMKKLTSLYVVSLYGISQDPTTDEILIITQLMENGDLKSWLQRLTDLPSLSILLRFSKDIATGMAYLEYRNYVHRDLACRNILLGPNGNRVKIADFGLSTIVDTDDKNRREEAHAQKLATRWLAPELLHNRAAYSIKSDVWSFGIVLIELWLKGGDPYGDQHRAWIESAVRDGYVHPKPYDCSDDFYQSIICQCFKFEANHRPSFSALKQLLEKMQFS